MNTVKATVLRNFRSGPHRGIKGKPIELPAELAAELAKGDKPAIKLGAKEGK